MKKPSVKDMIPEYPATRHLPWNPNSKGDKIASEQEAACIFDWPFVTVQEKVDGANCGMVLTDDGHPAIRNRTKILRKGDLSKDLNPSLAQFASAFTWFYRNKAKFEKLTNLLGPVSVYGEWMVQQHGMVYDKLPDWFIAFDVYDYEVGKYLHPSRAIAALVESGFSVVPTLHEGRLHSYEELERLAYGPSQFANVTRGSEGIYVKVSDGMYVTERFKLVRQGFEQGCLLGDEIKKNQLGT